MGEYRVMKKCQTKIYYRYILALDPSGSFYEGKGTTGWCVFDTKENKFITCGSLFAKDYKSAEEYWDSVIDLINYWIKIINHKDIILVCEDYLLYATKLQDQINSRMETCKLIGAIQWHCYVKDIPYYMQTASEVKTRWSNKILEHKGYIRQYRRGYTLTSGLTETYTHHTLDAVRHAIHYATFRNRR